MIATPFNGPRRLRIDADGHILDCRVFGWPIGAIRSDCRKVHSARPACGERNTLRPECRPGTAVLCGVNGNQSDSIMSFHIESSSWRVFPMPRKQTFTRDIEIAGDGSVYTSNSHFPSWMIEGGQPTLIHVEPGVSADPIVAAGRALYEQHCDTCHSMPDAKAPGIANT